MKVQLTIKQSEFSKIAASVKDYVDKVGIEASRMIAADLNNEANIAIQIFYRSYTPKVYERNYYNFMDNSHKGFTQKRLGVYEGGVELDASFLDDIYEDPVDTVFKNVFEGYHGDPVYHEKFNIPRMMPTPMEMIFERRDEIVRSYLAYILADAQFRI